MKAVQLTSAHPAMDNRIFFKECISLQANGFDVTLIAPHPQNECVNGVHILALPIFKSKLLRLMINPLLLFWKAIRQPAKIYHFHDPELIPVGLALRLLGKKVIYDIHEDYVSSIQQKEYLPRILARTVAPIFGFVESSSAKAFHLVIAEKYYNRRFPRSTSVLNYPKIDELPPRPPKHNGGPARFIYTGNITVNRGALIHANIVNLLPSAEVHFVGHCSTDLANRMRTLAGTNHARLFFYGIDRYLPFSEIEATYQSGEWSAGLAIFPNIAHYREKELTKFFEYMAYGLPIIASDFKVWRELIADRKAGLCVNPADPAAIKMALEEITNKPELALKMGDLGRESVEKYYLWKGQEANLIDLYQSMCR